MTVPKDLLYSETHKWVRRDGELTYLGITEYAAKQLGMLMFASLPEEGKELKRGEIFAELESVKTLNELDSPVGGTVARINDVLLDTPEVINADAYANWICAVRNAEISGLLTAEEYEKLCR